MAEVAALFVRSDSIYKTMSGVDAWDEARDATNWPGGAPVVAHPPCGPWGRLQHFCKPSEFERSMGPWAVDRVREWGGVLEHPAYSQLWLYCGLPKVGAIDEWGGFTVPIVQSWWGHRAEKATWLYVVGSTPAQLPQMPLRLGEAERVVSSKGGKRQGSPGWRPHIRKAERESTPPPLAVWLVELAASCRV